MRTMKAFSASLLAIGCLIFMESAHAQWKPGTITQIIYSTTGTNDAITVSGTFSSGCTYNGFILWPSDTYFAQIYAAVLASKASGTPFEYYHVYCHGSGYARANLYKW